MKQALGNLIAPLRAPAPQPDEGLSIFGPQPGQEQPVGYEDIPTDAYPIVEVKESAPHGEVATPDSTADSADYARPEAAEEVTQPIEPMAEPNKSSLGESVKNAASKAFRAPGYLSDKLSQAVDSANSAAGKAYAKVRYSRVANVAETGVASLNKLAVGALAVKLVAGVAQHKGIHMPDIDMPNINISTPFDQDEPQVPAEAQPVTPAASPQPESPTPAAQPETPAPGQGAVDAIEKIPAPTDPVESHDQKGGSTPDTIEAKSGEGAIKVTERIFDLQAEHAGSDLRADDLTDKQFAAVQEAFIDDKGNKGDFYGDGLMNEDVTYDTTDAKEIADKLIGKLDPDAKVYDGVPAPTEPTEQPAVATPAQPANTEAADKLAADAADAVVDAAEKSYEETKAEIEEVKEAAKPDEPNVFERGWNNTANWLSDAYHSVDTLGQKYLKVEYALGGAALAATMVVVSSSAYIAMDIRERLDNRAKVDIKEQVSGVVTPEQAAAFAAGTLTLEELKRQNPVAATKSMATPPKPRVPSPATSGALFAALATNRLAAEEGKIRAPKRPTSDDKFDFDDEVDD